jgi:hypothetical protein
MKFVRVYLTREYIVPADRQDMIDEARDCIEGDIASLITDGVHFSINVEDAPNATLGEVDDHIAEVCRFMQDDEEEIAAS